MLHIKNISDTKQLHCVHEKKPHLLYVNTAVISHLTVWGVYYSLNVDEEKTFSILANQQYLKYYTGTLMNPKL